MTNPRTQGNSLDWLNVESEPAIDNLSGQVEACESVHPCIASHGLDILAGHRYTGDQLIGGVDCCNALAFRVYDQNANGCGAYFVRMAEDGATEDVVSPGKPIAGHHTRAGSPASGYIGVCCSWMDMLAVHASTGHGTVSVFYPGNIESVVVGLKQRCPNAAIVICVDDSDLENFQVAAATAHRLDLPLASPGEGRTVCELYRADGADAVARCFSEAAVPGANVLGENDSADLFSRPKCGSWSTRINGAAMARHAAIEVRRHLVVPTHSPCAMVLWVIVTYLRDFIRVAPILSLFSATKRCGKTTAMALLQAMVYNPCPVSNISTAALYRMLKDGVWTMLIDEADMFLENGNGMMSIVNGGHTKGNAFVLRNNPRTNRNERFNTFFLKAIAHIGHMLDTVEDRSIIIELQRKSRHQQVKKYVASANDAFSPMRAGFSRWARDNAVAIAAAPEEELDLGNDRFSDNWEPLLNIASVMGHGWLEIAKEAATVLSRRANDAASGPEDLIRAVCKIFSANGNRNLTTKELIDGLCSDEEGPWPTMNRGKAITPHLLAELLANFNIASTNIRTPDSENGSRVVKGYKFEEFKDVFDRYVDDDDLA